MLQGANLPEDAILKSIEDEDRLQRSARMRHPRLADIVGETKASTAGAAVRQAAMRGMLTLRRYERGTSQGQLELRESEALAIAQEIEELRPPPQYHYQAPTSFEETMERIFKFLDTNSRPLYPDYHEQYRDEFQLLTRSLQQFLPHNEAEAEARSKDVELLTRFMGQVRYWEKWHRPDALSTRAQMWTNLESLEKSSSWSTLLKEHPFFRSKVWEQEVTKHLSFSDYCGLQCDYDTDYQALEEEHQAQYYRSKLRGLSQVLPPERVIAISRDELLKEMRDPFGKLGWARLAHESLSSELNLRLGNLFFQEVWPHFSVNEKFKYLEHGSLLSAFGDPVQLRRVLAQLDREAKHNNEPHRAEAVRTYREVLLKLWDSRGFLAAMEGMVNPGAIDWETLAGEHVEPSAVRQSVRRSFKSWLQDKSLPPKPARPKTPPPPGQPRLPPPRFDHGMVEIMGPEAQENEDELSSLLNPQYGPSLPKLPEEEGGMTGGVGTSSGYRFFVSSADLRERPSFCGWMHASTYDQLASLGAPENRYVQRLQRNMLESKPQWVETFARNQIRQSLAKLPPQTSPYEAFLAMYEGLDQGLRERCDASLYGDEIDKSDLSPALKKELLTLIYLCREGDRFFGRGVEKRSEDMEGTVALLLKYGVIQRPSDLIPRSHQEVFYDPREEAIEQAKNSNARGWYRLKWNANIAQHLSQELKDAVGQSPELLKESIQRILGETHTSDRRTLKLKGEVAKAARTLEWNPQERVHHKAKYYGAKARKISPAQATFRDMIEGGVTNETDLFFLEKVFPELQHQPEEIRDFLENDSIHSDKIRLELTMSILEPNVQRLEQQSDQSVLTREAAQLVAVIDNWVPNASLAKDNYLEELAWRLQFEGKALQGLIEDRKSYNYERANGLLANLGSAVGGYLGQMRKSTRRDLLRYLMSPEPGNLPPSVSKELASYAKDTTKLENRQKLVYGGLEYSVEAFFEKVIFESSLRERIPLIDMLLGSGPQALCHHRDYPLNITRDILGYPKDSLEEKLLTAFLEVIPEHERTVTLAYALTHLPPNDPSKPQMEASADNIKHLFEIFQSVGIKLGQLISIFGVFGEEFSKKTRGLRDNALPMTKKQVEEVMHSTLKPEELKRIKLLGILGSASMKTVVLVELDGRPVVMMVQRPHAPEQVESNLRLGDAFLQKVQEKNIEMPLAMLQMLLEPLGEQLQEELRMTLEAQRIDIAAQNFPLFNQRLTELAQGWRFEVPSVCPEIPPRDNLMFVELAEGVAFDELDGLIPPEEKAQLGRFVVKSCLQMLFQEGIFEPDRHLGNWKFDVLRKVISAFDMGQLESYKKTSRLSWDDRMAIARFLQGMEEKNAAMLAEVMLRMSKEESARSVDVKRLRAGLEKELRGLEKLSVENQLTALVSAAAEAGLKFEKKFLFGAVKGLLVLGGEGYVSPKEFHALLKDEVRTLLRSKAPALVKESIRSWFA